MGNCVHHLNFTDSICEDCGLFVDKHGNTEVQFDNCCFPDCGCDGARLCMAPSGANQRALGENVEAMWIGTSPKHLKARQKFIVSVMKENNET